VEEDVYSACQVLAMCEMIPESRYLLRILPNVESARGWLRAVINGVIL